MWLKMSAKSLGNYPSLAWQFNGRWALRLLATFIKINLLLAFLAFIGLIWMAEQQTANGYVLYQQMGNLDIPGIAINSSSSQPAGRQMPVSLRKILPPATQDGYRDFFYINRSESQSFWARVDALSYRLTIVRPAGNLIISYHAGDNIRAVIVFFMIILTYQALLWLGGIFWGIRTARRILQPISELAQFTTVLHERQPHLTWNRVDTLQDLAGTIGQIDVDRLSTRLSIEDTQQELHELAKAINNMLERIDQAYHSQARFVSDASHELKTPIAVIQGYANLLDRWGKNDENTLQESIEAIKSEAKRMKILVDDLLFLAHGDSDSLMLNREPVDLAALLDEVHRETMMLDAEHVFEYKPAAAPVVSVDAALIKQAVRVLIDNAIKYTPPQQIISLSLTRRDGLVCINVQDEGIGIPPPDLPHIFDRFFRSDPSRTRTTGGAGLGLSIAKWIVEKHGGHFEVLSRMEIGTRITICLPE